MTISQAQLVDFFNKKIGYGVAKTDTSTAKSPSNESNASPILSPASTIWQQDNYIVHVTTLPTGNANVVAVHRDSLSSTVQCVRDSTASGTNQTWFTNQTDWIPTQYGPGFQVQLYAAPTGTSNPQATGVALPQAGSGNNDAWTFDYQAGIVNFADTNVPTAVTYNGSTGNVVYAVGARYVGPKGITSFPDGLTIGEVSISGNTVTAGNLIGTLLTNAQPNITTVGNLGNLVVLGNLTVSNIDITGTLTGNVTSNSGSFNGNVVANWFIGNVVGNIGNFSNYIVTSNLVSSNSYITNTAVQLQDVKIIGNTISSTTTDLVISANLTNPNNIVRFNSVSAVDIPSGTTAQRPPNPNTGYFRFNTDIGSVEWWAGSNWTSGAATITAQTIYPDGVNDTFTLNAPATAEGVLVSINGTVQQASGYTVVDDQLTFAEIPLVTDIIEVRYLSAGLAVAPYNGGQVGGNIVPGTTLTYDIGSTDYLWKDLWLGGNIETPGAFTFTGNGVYASIGSGNSGTTYSYQFNGTSNGVRLPASTNLDFNSGDFTIEFWMRAGASQTTYSMIADASTNNTKTGMGVGQNVGGTPGKFSFWAQGNLGGVLNSTTSVLDNTWRHFACVKNGANGYLFVDGSLEASTSGWSGITAASLSDGCIGRSRFGSGTNGDNVFAGYLSNFRVVKGTALYTSTFVPPTTQLSAISNTQLLTLQSATVIDNSTNAFSLTGQTVLPTASTSVVPNISGTSVTFPTFVYDTVGNVVLTVSGNATVSGNIFQQGSAYKTYGNVLNSGGNLTCNFNNGSTFYANLTANVTANFTNVNAINNTVTTATIIIDQGATAYQVANVQINGAMQTVKWLGATAGKGSASNTDIISFSLIYLGGSAYRVLGEIHNYG